jgi:hypothetical protein
MIDGSDAEKPPTELVVVENWSEELNRLVPTEGHYAAEFFIAWRKSQSACRCIQNAAWS